MWLTANPARGSTEEYSISWSKWLSYNEILHILEETVNSSPLTNELKVMGLKYSLVYCVLCIHAQCLYMFPQAGQSASDDLLAVKDAHIAALQTELRGKDKILQVKAKVGAGLS